ncbi:MAG: threonine--tRNA ligase [Planctomycetes bacterium]|nr:threonine--tRNA ligase [Planctomycetota bacterium]
MVNITLPDGKGLEFDGPVSCLQVAEAISEGLARAAVAADLDGRRVDLATTIADGAHTLRLLTPRDADSLEVLRHTTAHVLAHAMRRLYGPAVQYTIGPALTDDFQYGFYYDFDLPRPISAEDLPKIEAEMQAIVREDIPLVRRELTVEQAKAHFRQLGQGYKVEMIDDLARTEGVGAVSLYEEGDFVDLCRGPHLPSTGKVKAFKLITLAGAYWRGDEANKMLVRVYGTAFFDKKELKAQLDRVEEARKRDHRVLGRQLGLFLLSDQVGPGLPVWMPKGAIIRQELESWIRGELIRRGYSVVYTPHIGRLDLYRTSGHYPYYSDSQFPPVQMSDEEGYLLKPMNCPHHIQIYKAEHHSYRDLPIRLAEFGQVYRFEQSGELSGLTRVRGFCQDDAHIFCTADQLEDEIAACIDLVKLVLSTLGLEDFRVRVGLRDPDSSKYVGSSDNWDRAETNIRHVVSRSGLPYSEEAGEAAFYGPKIDFVVTDCIGREWQLGTVQVDYNLPERFGLEYIGDDNVPHQPVMIHRAPFGSLERFIGILIEHFAGAFPLWLSPVQVAVLPVSDKYNEYGRAVRDALVAAGLRVDLVESADKIGAKIRQATLQKIPYMCIVGDREQQVRAVSVRHRTAGDAGTVPLDVLVERLTAERDSRGGEVAFAPAGGTA